jgi:hypothetical protein
MQMDYDLKMKELEMKGIELAEKQREMHLDAGMELEKMRHENQTLRIQAKTQVHPEVAMSDPDLNDGEVTPISQMMQQMGQMLLQSQQMMQQGFEQLSQQQAQGDAAIINAVQAPRKTEVIRDEAGRIQAGVSSTIQ